MTFLWPQHLMCFDPLQNLEQFCAKILIVHSRIRNYTANPSFVIFIISIFWCLQKLYFDSSPLTYQLCKILQHISHAFLQQFLFLFNSLSSFISISILPNNVFLTIQPISSVAPGCAWGWLSSASWAAGTQLNCGGVLGPWHPRQTDQSLHGKPFQAMDDFSAVFNAL